MWRSLMLTLLVVTAMCYCNTIKRSTSSSARDYRGCDAIVASCGPNGGCCDEHDACYKKYDCTAISWFYLWGNCVGCNNAVMACIAARNPGPSTCCSQGNCGTNWRRFTT